MRGWGLVLVVAIILAGCRDIPPDVNRMPPPPALPPMSSISLPKTAGPWTRPDASRRIDKESIFSYMDGGGELYIGYRFDHLDVYEYAAAGRDPILVELYWMLGSDDAFGLLSLDWGGEAVALQPADPSESPRVVPASRALYGAGLLRIWTDTLYARVLASNETPESRAQVMALGRAIVAGRARAPRPVLLDLLPERTGDDVIRRDRVAFFRSHLVLNSAYFVASANILDLSLACDAVLAPYETAAPAQRPRGNRGAASRVQLLLVRYPDAAAARRALSHFLGVYLPQARDTAIESDRPVAGAQRVERGWVGYRLDDRLLRVAFDAPDAPTANLVTAGR